MNNLWIGGDDAADYTLTFGFDLAGNRLIQSKWTTAEADIEDPADEYTYDASDRLTVETFYDDDVATTQTTYTYTATEQTGKEVVNLSTNKTTTRTQMSYDLQGWLSQIVIEQLDENEDVIRRETQQYVYNTPAARTPLASASRKRPPLKSGTPVRRHLMSKSRSQCRSSTPATPQATPGRSCNVSTMAKATC